MSQFSSPLKLAPTSTKRGIQIGKNVLFVKSKDLKSYMQYIFMDKGKLSFVQATEVRKDQVYRRIVEELCSGTCLI